MSVKSSSPVRNTPFYPPGILSHKNVSKDKPFLSNSLKQRPQTVKEIKKLSNCRNDKMTSSFSGNENLLASHRLSVSTPDFKVSFKTTNSSPPAPKHNCDKGIGHGYFKATPLPPYYSTESLERNRSLWEHSESKLKSKSLDRISTKSTNRSLTGFSPTKPFYPPSLYPNGRNLNAQRIVEARNLYKTPDSRKIAHKDAKQKLSNRRKSLDPKIHQQDSKLVTADKTKSLPVLNASKSKSTKPIKKPIASKEIKKTGKKQIGPYRFSNRLDFFDPEQSHGKNSEAMTTSYFYPKPTIKDFFRSEDDIMARSLMNESTLANRIHTGSLKRAIAGEVYNLHLKTEEVTDLDDSPTKSYSPRKRSSFSADSLDERNKEGKSGECLENDLEFNSEPTASLAVDTSCKSEHGSSFKTELSGSVIHNIDADGVNDNFANEDTPLMETPSNVKDIFDECDFIQHNEKEEHSKTNEDHCNINEANLHNGNFSVLHQEDWKTGTFHPNFDESSKKRLEDQYNMDQYKETVNYSYDRDFNLCHQTDDGNDDRAVTPVEFVKIQVDQYNIDQFLFKSEPQGALIFHQSYTHFDSLPKDDLNDQCLLKQIASNCIVSTNEALTNGHGSYDFMTDEKDLSNRTFDINSPAHKNNKNNDGYVGENDGSTNYSTNNTQLSGLDYDGEYGNNPTKSSVNQFYPKNYFSLPRIQLYSEVQATLLRMIFLFLDSIYKETR